MDAHYARAHAGGVRFTVLDPQISLDAIFARSNALRLSIEAWRDVAECVNRLSNDNSQFWKRTYYRTLFSYFEAVLNGMKYEILTHSREYSEKLEPEVEIFLNDKKVHIKSNGEIALQGSFHSFEQNLKAIFRLYERHVAKNGYSTDYQTNGWSNLNSCLKVRNRITHPKKAELMEISDMEIQVAYSAFEWFLTELIAISGDVRNEQET